MHPSPPRDIPGTAGNIGGKAEEKFEQATERLEHEAHGFSERARAESERLRGMAGEKAHSVAESGKHDLANQIGQVAKALHVTHDQLRDEGNVFSSYTEDLAERADRLSHYLHERPTEDLLSEVENFARRKPALFLGGAFTIGLLAGRFIKSSARAKRQMLDEHDDTYARAGQSSAGYTFDESPASDSPPIGGF